ncbi:MAG: bifunctional 5,10-methylenetetrahydrofolate dehydrogenase/5,10-methenyltetrahydrofolate cyclohydrolase, partial [Opitutales bacterium]
KGKVAAEIGITSDLKVFPESISQEELLREIDVLNEDTSVHGILVQAPLPPPIDERTIFNQVLPEKDVDGFNAFNLGRLCQEDEDAFVACTPAGIIELLRRSEVETEGKRAVVLGRSLIVGKPTGLLLLGKGMSGNATVTVCHSRTRNLAAVIREADILVAAIGRPEFVTGDMVKPGATVIDVGINRVDDATKKRGYRLVGDVAFEEVAAKAAKITPVPGGVGPMTVAMLMRNTVKAFRLAQRVDP